MGRLGTVDDDSGLEGTVSDGGCLRPDEHPHVAGLSIGRRRKVWVVGAAAILCFENHLIISDAAVAVIARLKVASGLGETKLVEKVMVHICRVEQLRDGGIRVDL